MRYIYRTNLDIWDCLSLQAATPGSIHPRQDRLSIITFPNLTNKMHFLTFNIQGFARRRNTVKLSR